MFYFFFWILNSVFSWNVWLDTVCISFYCPLSFLQFDLVFVYLCYWFDSRTRITQPYFVVQTNTRTLREIYRKKKTKTRLKHLKTNQIHCFSFMDVCMCFVAVVVVKAVTVVHLFSIDGVCFFRMKTCTICNWNDRFPNVIVNWLANR